mgnify:CR=1 FL=1
MVYYYFVSGTILQKKKKYLYFNTEIGLHKRISSIKDIAKFSKDLANVIGVNPETLTVLNYQFLRTE